MPTATAYSQTWLIADKAQIYWPNLETHLLLSKSNLASDINTIIDGERIRYV